MKYVLKEFRGLRQSSWTTARQKPWRPITTNLAHLAIFVTNEPRIRKRNCILGQSLFTVLEMLRMPRSTIVDGQM